MVFEIVVVALAVRAFSLDQRYEYF
jgi:hypothetical protein